MKQQKLLNKNLRYYMGYGLMVALVVIPAFYVITRLYIVHEIDEFLYKERNYFVEKNLPKLTTDEIPIWNQYNNYLTILSDMGEKEDSIFTSKHVYLKLKQYFKSYRSLYSPIEIEGEKYTLYINLNLGEFLEVLNMITIFLCLLVFCLMTGLAITTRLIHGKLWKPFYKTLSLTEQFNIQNDTVPIFQPTDTKEFEQLNNALKKLMKENVQTFKTQKEFTENASHEIQTPLAVLRSNLDILLQQNNLTEEQMVIIQTLYEATSRMVRINKNLLLLAKLDNLQFRDTQTINVADAIEASLSFLSAQTQAAKIALGKEVIDRTLTVQANKILFESLVNNLITNAIKHNISDGMLLVTLKENRLLIINTGVENRLDDDMLFRRFSCLNVKTKGSGLGLAIVRQICLLYNWQINYSFEDTTHRFEVVF